MENVLPILVVATVLITAVAFIRQIRNARRRIQSKCRATIGFFAYSISPLLAYAFASISLVGIEELTGQTIIVEGHARTPLPVMIAGGSFVIATTALFLEASAFLTRRDERNEGPSSTERDDEDGASA